MNAIISLSLAGANVMSDHLGRKTGPTVLDGLRYLSRERKAWPDDLTDELEWSTAKAFTAFIVARGAEECASSVMHSPADAEKLQEMIGVALLHGTLAIQAGKVPLCEDNATLAKKVIDCIVYESGKLRLSPENSRHVSAMSTIAAKWILDNGITKPLTLEEAWSVSRGMYNAKPAPIRVSEPTSPAITKQRRLRANPEPREPFVFAISKAMPMMRGISNHPTDPLFRKFAETAGILPLLKGDKSQVFLSTCMTVEAYEEFKKFGRYRDVWETGPTWHRKYSDQPLVARANHEMKLFGERGDGIVYGYLTTCEGWQDDVSVSGARGYGEVEIFWKPELLRYCTFTIEDSHGADFAMDANNADQLAFCALLTAAFRPWVSLREDPYLSIIGKAIAPTLRGLAGRFLEFQCHHRLTTSDVESVLIHGKEIAP